MDAGISVGHVQLKSILRSNSIPPKASSQVVTFGPTVTIATDPAYGSNSEESENEKILAENKSNGQSDLDAEKPDYPEHNKEAVDEDGSDAGSDDSVVCLDDKTEDDINQVMISLISESLKPSRFNFVQNISKSIPNLHLAAGDLRERRQQLLAEMRFRREKPKTTPVSEQSRPSLELEKKIDTTFQHSNVKHEHVHFNDKTDLDQSSKEIREFRAFISPETSHLMAIQLVYEREDATVTVTKIRICCGNDDISRSQWSRWNRNQHNRTSVREIRRLQ